MARNKSRPSGGRPGGRKGGAGVGPGPGYKPSTSGGGTRHTPGSSTGSRTMALVAVVLFGVPLLVFLAAVGYVVNGYV